MTRYTKTEEDQRLEDEWLAKKGNAVTVCDPGDRTDPDEIAYTWGKKKKVVDKSKK
tara:strand:- start:716 stop:883 length:168 start_codon:yes stop_codon:yes gene_type:complete